MVIKKTKRNSYFLWRILVSGWAFHLIVILFLILVNTNLDEILLFLVIFIISKSLSFHKFRYFIWKIEFVNDKIFIIYVDYFRVKRIKAKVQFACIKIEPGLKRNSPFKMYLYIEDKRQIVQHGYFEWTVQDFIALQKCTPNGIQKSWFLKKYID